MLETITAFFIIIALLGTFLNSKGRVEGFYFWVISNTAFSCINMYQGNIAMSILFTIYVILALYGILNWSKPKK